MARTRQNWFVIAPIGDAGSPERRVMDGLLHAVRRVGEKHGAAVTAAHTISAPGRITVQIVEHLRTADLVFADLSGLNANVMWELGVRYQTKLPVIAVARRGTALPFDLKDERTVFYVDDLAGGKDLILDLGQAVESALLVGRARR